MHPEVRRDTRQTDVRLAVLTRKKEHINKRRTQSAAYRSRIRDRNSVLPTVSVEKVSVRNQQFDPSHVRPFLSLLSDHDRFCPNPEFRCVFSHPYPISCTSRPRPPPNSRYRPESGSPTGSCIQGSNSVLRFVAAILTKPHYLA